MAKTTNKLSNLLMEARHAILGTHSLTRQGYPFTSLVTFVIADTGAAVICASRLSEHYRNLSADGRGSLLICDPPSNVDPYAGQRATMLGKFVEMKEVASVQTLFSQKYPQSGGQQIIPDLVYFALNVISIRWVIGYSEVCWLSDIDYASLMKDRGK